jgi:hypothetical protein
MGIQNIIPLCRNLTLTFPIRLIKKSLVIPFEAPQDD